MQKTFNVLYLFISHKGLYLKCICRFNPELFKKVLKIYLRAHGDLKKTFL